MRRNYWITFKGKRQTVSQWAREKKMNHQTIIARIKRGWTIERTLNQLDG